MASGRELIVQVESAFPGLDPYMGDVTLVGRDGELDWESEWYERAYGGKSWREIDDATIRSSSTALRMMNSSARCFFLPALLRDLIRDLGAGTSGDLEPCVSAALGEDIWDLEMNRQLDAAAEPGRACVVAVADWIRQVDPHHAIDMDRVRQVWRPATV
ncbi:MAG: hypothetical protein AB8G96_10105 [Phycisphaerales bacterium]